MTTLTEKATAVEIDNVTAGYGRAPVLTDISLRIAMGDFTGILGPSGSGKTTLLRLILGALKPISGSVSVMGRPARGRISAKIGYVPQLETVDWNFPVTVEEVVLMGQAATSSPWPWTGRRDRNRVGAILEKLGISEFASRHIRQLSGGEQQRTFLARALYRDPEILLLDEPTAGVDVATRRQILDLLIELNAEGVAVVMTTHDLNSVAANLPNLVCLNETVIAAGRPDEVLTPSVLKKTFGSPMVVLDHAGKLLVAEIPDEEQHGKHGHHIHLHDDHPGGDENREVGA